MAKIKDKTKKIKIKSKKKIKIKNKKPVPTEIAENMVSGIVYLIKNTKLNKFYINRYNDLVGDITEARVYCSRKYAENNQPDNSEIVSAIIKLKG